MCIRDRLDFDQNYPEGSLITIYHDISFPAVEDLITFVRIIKEHDYQILSLIHISSATLVFSC